DYYGCIFFKHYDGTLQGARSGACLAKRSYQMVAIASYPAVDKAASLRVRHVTKYFPAPNGTGVAGLALDDVSLSIAAGELVSVVGPSGCGNSTLLRLIAGRTLPTKGELSIG